jgi:4-hydroxybutyrate CoA-transferase
MPELIERARSVGPLTVITSMIGPLPEFARPENLDVFRIVSFRGTPELKRSHLRSNFGVIPANMSAIPRLFQSGALRPYAAIVQCSPPDAGGMCSLGTSVLFHRSAIAASAIAIAVLNATMPRTSGNSLVPIDTFDIVIELDHPLVTTKVPTPSDVERKVAHQVVRHVPDGSTVQVGIGGLSEAIFDELSARRELRLWGGMFGDGAARLERSGALIDTDVPIVTGSVLGSEALYRYVADNPRIEFRPAEETHSPAALTLLPNFVAINSAIEVDLSGQVNAERIAGWPVSGAGGQAEFMRAASMKPGGCSIIALTAATSNGERSKIVPRLGEGSVITTPRTDVDIIVTEFGSADLRGKTDAQRAEAIAAIADPRFGITHPW